MDRRDLNARPHEGGGGGRRGRLAVSLAFALAIGTSVWRGGSGIVVSGGAGVLGGAVWYLMSRLLSGGGG